MDNYNKYKVIVIGAGIAGCEAALNCSRMGLKTLIINISMDNPAMLKYSPKFGGRYKGNILNEIKYFNNILSNAIYINEIAKLKENINGISIVSYIVEKRKFSLFYKYLLESHKNLDTRQGLVTDIKEVNINSAVEYEVVLNDNSKFYTEAIIITVGTFLNAKILWGKNNINAGRHGEINSLSLSNTLKDMGYNLIKTRTYISPSVDIKTINLNKIEKVKSELLENNNLSLDENDKEIKNILNFKDYIKNERSNKYFCYKSKTRISNLKKIFNTSYSSNIGIETLKMEIDNFYDDLSETIENIVIKEKLKEDNELNISLYPEGNNTMSLYVEGFKSILSEEIQQLLLNQFYGLESCLMTKPGYCIEYFSIDKSQLKKNFESKINNNIFFAGEVIGRSCYEEIILQGLLAGINAALKIYGNRELIIDDEKLFIGKFINLFFKNNFAQSYKNFENLDIVINNYNTNEAKEIIKVNLKILNDYIDI